MKRIFTCALCVVNVMLIAACSAVDTSHADKKTSVQDATKIQINRPLHFPTPDGGDAMVQAGAYRVEKAADSTLRLVPTADAPPVLISAQATDSTFDVPAAVALGTLFESEVYHLLFLAPGNNALETHGSVSEVQSRGLLDAKRGMVFMRLDRLVLQPPQPQPLPDLVPTCVRPEEINLGVTYLHFLHGGVKNQGTAASGPSKARNGASTVDVQGLMPGQFVAVTFSSGIQPPTSYSVQVDVANQVVESNEQNNSGQQRC